MYITVKGMLRQSIQRVKAMLLCIEYGILFVDTVDTKIKACNALNVMLCQDCQYRCLWLLHNTLYRVLWGVKNSTLYTMASNTNVDTVDTRHKVFLIHSMLHPHISAHNLLNIQTDFQSAKKFSKAENEGFSTISSNTMYVKSCDILYEI